MSGSQGGDVKRPWHGAANPLDALHDWVLGELAALRRELEASQLPRLSSADDIKSSSSPPPSALGLSGPPNTGNVAASSGPVSGSKEG